MRGEVSELPHDTVEGCNAEEVPLRGNPAPELIERQRMLLKSICSTHESWTIDLPSAFGVDEEIYQGWYEGASVAPKEIGPLQSPHAFCSPSTKQGEVNIETHA